ncbi:MAG: hypothetical protein QM784_15855 [Polyangiaceae bacterium]
MRMYSIGSIAFGTILAMLVLCTGACKRDVSANQSAAPESSSLPLSAAALAQTAATMPQPKFDEVAFRLESSAPGDAKVGEAFQVKLALTAKPPFHVNAEYPHRFKVISVANGKAGADLVTRDPAKLSPSSLEVLVPVTAAGSGKGELVGELSFSLCTDDKCLMEKRKLKAEFAAN